MAEMPPDIAVIGSGAWGTALAANWARAGNAVRLWCRRVDVAYTIQQRRRHPETLSDVLLPEGLTATSELSDLADTSILILATPSDVLRSCLSAMQDAALAPDILILTTKGLDEAAYETSSDENIGFLSTACEAYFPGARIGVLSGPSFARDVADGLPTAVTLAFPGGVPGILLHGLATPQLRLYASDDPVGVQIGGAVKNVMAIACGIAEGRGLGQSARAALMTRGLAEIMRLADAMGAKRETMMGLAGLGDLSLTCNSTQSRNFAFGTDLGRAGRFDPALMAGRTVEGVRAARLAALLAAARGVEMPITRTVDAILHEDAEVEAMIGSLLARPLKSES